MRDIAEDVLKFSKVNLIGISYLHIQLSTTSRTLLVLGGYNLLLWSQKGLERRGHNEAGFLEELDEVVRSSRILFFFFLVVVYRASLKQTFAGFKGCHQLSKCPSYLFPLMFWIIYLSFEVFLVIGVTPAEKLHNLYYGKWGENIDRVFRDCWPFSIPWQGNGSVYLTLWIIWRCFLRVYCIKMDCCVPRLCVMFVICSAHSLLCKVIYRLPVFDC